MYQDTPERKRISGHANSQGAPDPVAQCPSQIIETLIHFTARDAMDIEGIGVEWINKLAKKGVLKNVSDFYYLSKQDLLQFDRMGDKLADNMINSILEDKKGNLWFATYNGGVSCPPYSRLLVQSA